jgi:glycosyltransferase Alg8
MTMTVTESGARKWNARALFGVLVYISVITIGLLSTPSRFYDEISHDVVVTLGAFGVWRFGWWGTHLVRAIIYSRIVYPRMRRAARKIWDQGGRPTGIHFMITTFLERPETTLQVIRSVLHEARTVDLPTTIWLGSGDASDEEAISAILDKEAADLDIQLVISRQNRPGKRYAIGMSLRAMRRFGLQPQDIVVFMDGDAVIMPGMLETCLPLFLADPKLEALTTDEEVVVYGPKWVNAWLAMRFAQRRLAMQSHSLSRKVLTLTGRLSLFRAQHVTRREFIEILEEDHLSHWLWGRFRFLSGDDKSTWYYMLRLGARMIYVPDALSLTIEYIEGNGSERAIQNLRRWSGNMLRNGARAIGLGPRRVGFFIWWCLIDQRLAMWTMLVGPVLAFSAAFSIGPQILVTYFAWVLFTRLVQSLILWCFSREVHLLHPVLLYVNQLANAVVKVYCLFRLSKQRWTNRGNQNAGFGTSLADHARSGMAVYMTAIATILLVMATVVVTGLVRLPTIYTAATATALLGRF